MYESCSKVAKPPALVVGRHSKMKTNFKIEDNYAVQYDGYHIDLHNNFDFEGMAENSDGKEIRLEFKKSDGDWISEDEFTFLTFVLKDVTYKYLKDGDPVNYPEGSKCLGEISFFPSEMREMNDSIIPQQEPKETDDLIFIFEDDKVIRVNCKQAELIVKK